MRDEETVAAQAVDAALRILEKADFTIKIIDTAEAWQGGGYDEVTYDGSLCVKVYQDAAVPTVMQPVYDATNAMMSLLIDHEVKLADFEGRRFAPEATERAELVTDREGDRVWEVPVWDGGTHHVAEQDFDSLKHEIAKAQLV